MEKVRQILQEQFHVSEWVIAFPADGQQQACYIAESKKLKVFIKFDVPISALQRLGEIGVAPRVLASGIKDGRSYIIQEYIAGRYPDWHWFAEHLSSLATFVKRYHGDEQLASLLSQDVTTDYAAHIALDIAELERQFRSLDAGVLRTPAITSAVDELKRQASKLQPVKLVPVHTDPNTKNMLLVADKLLMVDWDDVRLSDPMQDVGLLLWWYVAKQRWSEFFAVYGLQADDLLVNRIFWWAARTSFAVALWHVEHGYDCNAFVADFVAALNRESNPHAVFD